ncbi:MAG: hypothetical protein ACOCP4_04650 [Candidatus Woesearchaeota archaeon]
MIHKKIGDHRYLEAGMITNAIYIFAIYMSGYVFTGLRTLNINEMIYQMYQLDFIFNETLMVFLPVLIFSIIITNIYLLFKRFRYIFNTNIRKYKVTTKKQIYSLAVMTSFIGLFYFNEITTSYVTKESQAVINGAETLLLVILTAMLIPALFNVLQENKNENNIEQHRIIDRKTIHTLRKH